MTTQDGAQQSDLKNSFAWGQLFAGSVIGGLAVWKLLHKMTDTEPSEWFFGLSRAYEEWRDFLMTPLQWAKLDLSVDERNFLVVFIILLSSFLRVRRQKRRGVDGLVQFGVASIVALLAFSLLIVPVYCSVTGACTPLDGAAPPMNDVARVGVITIAVVLTFVGTAAVTMGILLGLRRPNNVVTTASSLILMNALFTTLWGTALLLLNWATS